VNMNVRIVDVGTKDATPHVRLCGELTAQPHVWSPCGPVQHPWWGRWGCVSCVYDNEECERGVGDGVNSRRVGCVFYFVY
jgi:hypothetical protein